ncbi:heavy metal translocating P-type ATPase [Parasporobacterium paucivorans]|uniref:P-type Cu(+) transporter n=1 Tax=Parasporobacterium paucivorans DSM 15970 TaxID=1122934 RepID=A0A1M6JG19_9FIRM|nr:heavy metal translocating P-type ATPase [Parasporobacterium paucivorans]SHJ45646.1 Cu2+-exporting ATPase [Parasporobacterium paucivorans DSM 15970]
MDNHEKMDHSKMNHPQMDEDQKVHPEHHEHDNHHEMMVVDLKKRFLFSIILMLPILALSPMIQMFMGVDWRFAGDTYLLFALSTVIFFYGGKPFLKGAIDEFKKKSPAMMMLIALAITVAYVYSALTVFVLKGNDFFWELATLVVIMLLGHWIEMKSVMKASKALEELAKLMPEIAHFVGENGETRDIPVKDLMEGDMVLVKPGEKVPIDGIIYEGSSSVNESMLTGESVPVDKRKGDEIIGGAINGEGVLKFRVNRIGENTFLSQIIKMVREAQESKSNTQRLADIAAKWLFYIAVSAGAVTFIVWMAVGSGLNFAIERAVTVMVISCPHALGLATPLVTAVSTSIGAKHGLLIRNRAAFENARKINSIVFDKTGTLTEGEFGITDIHEVSATKDGLLTIAYSVELNSEHPIARGIVKEGSKKSLERLEVTDYQNITGEGLMAKVRGRDTRIVSPGYMRSKNISFDVETYERLAQEGKTVVFVLEEEKLLGFIALSDIVRDSAKEAVETLRSMDVESIMLTGDNKRVAAYVGESVGIDKVIAEVLPQEKASKIEELQAKGRIIGMTGDGVNDAPSLAAADLGIAIGAGTDVAIETAGVLYNQGIIISPALGAILMSLSTIIVSINARLLKAD